MSRLDIYVDTIPCKCGDELVDVHTLDQHYLELKFRGRRAEGHYRCRRCGRHGVVVLHLDDYGDVRIADTDPDNSFVADSRQPIRAVA